MNPEALIAGKKYNITHSGLKEDAKEGRVGVFAGSFVYETSGALEFHDLTDDVDAVLKKHGIKDGIVTVFTAHTTTAIKINEKEAGFFNDFKEFMQKLLPSGHPYNHNDFDLRDPATFCEIGEECSNGHSHCQQMLVGSSSETIPVRGGKMLLGRWQRIFLIELDHARERTVHVQIIGM